MQLTRKFLIAKFNFDRHIYLSHFFGATKHTNRILINNNRTKKRKRDKGEKEAFLY